MHLLETVEKSFILKEAGYKHGKHISYIHLDLLKGFNFTTVLYCYSIVGGDSYANL